MDDGMMIDDAQGCNEAGEKLYPGPSQEKGGHPGAIEGESERRQANTRLILSPST
jgi:hypothetical protein